MNGLQTYPPELVRAVHQARREHRHLYLVHLPVADRGDREEILPVVFRLLTLEEFDAFSQDAALGDITDLIIETVVLYPQMDELLRVRAGHFEELASLAVSLSGYESKDALEAALAEGRQSTNNIFVAAHLFISRALPSVSFESLQQMSVTEMFRHVAMAEHLIGQPFPFKEFFKAPKISRPKIPWENLPELTPAQVAEMRGDADTEALVARQRRMRRQQSDPEGQARRRKEAREAKLRDIAARRAAAELRGSSEETQRLRSEYRGG